MANFETFFNTLLKDVKISITEEFDRNFERKAFFDKKWPDAKYKNRKGSLLMRSGALRRSILSKIQGHEIHFTSSEIYASIHNEGGEIKVTAKMKKYFWAMYAQVAGIKKGEKWSNTANLKKDKHGAIKINKTNKAVGVEAEYWKSLALMKVGTVLKIPERRFIGPHPQVDAEIQRIAKNNIANLENEINQMLAAQGVKVKNIRFK